jgi:DNA-binding PadR family transcriptional regulator
LHQLEKDGYVTCHKRVVAGRQRKNYRITARGRKLLRAAQIKLVELTEEVIKDHDRLAEARTLVRRGPA